MLKNIKIQILLISFFITNITVKSQGIPKYQLGCQINIGFHLKPEPNNKNETSLHYIPIAFAMDFGLKNTWFYKIKLTNLSYYSNKPIITDTKYLNQENINLINLALGYNFLHNNLKNQIRLSFCIGNYLVYYNPEEIQFSEKTKNKYSYSRFYYGIDAMYRYELKYNIAIGFEFDYGHANYIDKFFFSNKYQKVFCISLLISYSLKSY